MADRTVRSGTMLAKIAVQLFQRKDLAHRIHRHRAAAVRAFCRNLCCTGFRQRQHKAWLGRKGIARFAQTRRLRATTARVEKDGRVLMCLWQQLGIWDGRDFHVETWLRLKAKHCHRHQRCTASRVWHSILAGRSVQSMFVCMVRARASSTHHRRKVC